MPRSFLCQQCGKPVSTKNTKQKYCNQACYHKSRQKRVIKHCEQCGKEMVLVPKDAKKRRFCSYSCNNKSRAKTPETKPIPCPTCGKLFTPNRTKPETFCSFECYKKSAKRNQLRTCKHCKGQFFPAHSTIKFCSRYCMRTYSIAKNHVTKRCKHCAKKFMSRKSTNQIYCSVKCRATDINVFGPNNPNWRGGIEYNPGPYWEDSAKEARKRDNYICQLCGAKQTYPALDVHHIIPLRDFDGDLESAHQLDNLITLCRSCHNKVEGDNTFMPPSKKVVCQV